MSHDNSEPDVSPSDDSGSSTITTIVHVCPVCPVCQHNILESENSTTTPCHHEYHFDCFMRAVRISGCCAVCRAELYPDSDEVVPPQIENDQEEVVEISLASLGQESIDAIREQLRRRIRTNTDNPDEINVDDDDELSDFGDPILRRRRNEFNLFKYCEDGDISRVRSILERDPDMKYAEDDELNTLLHSSIFSDSETLVRFLVVDLAMPSNTHNLYRMTPLHFAASSKSTRLCRVLVNAGAFIDPQTTSGITPLMISCQKKDNSTCTFLMDNNASTRSFDSSGDSALHHAARCRSIACIRTILRGERVDVDSVNFFGESPLHLACASDSTTAVRILIEKGADVDLKNKGGKTPIEYVASDNSRLRAIVRGHSRF